jgi:LacI family transcriptional regulator
MMKWFIKKEVFFMSTIREVAKRAGVAPSTVSMFLRDDKNLRIRDETKKRIRKAVSDLNYQPNTYAQALSVGKSRSVGVIVCTDEDSNGENHPLIMGFLTGISQALQKKKYELALYTFRWGNNTDKIDTIIQSKKVDGLIFCPNTYESSYTGNIPKEIPFIAMSPRKLDLVSYSVGWDFTYGTYQAAMHLFSLGHRQVGLINGPQDSLIAWQIEQGYLLALKKYGLEANPELIKYGDFQREDGCQLGKELLSLSTPPTGIIAVDDMAACGVIATAREMEIQVPIQLSVVGYNDMPIASAYDIPLTTIKIPAVTVGRKAGEMLITLLEGDEIKTKHIEVQTKLVVRMSTTSCSQP